MKFHFFTRTPYFFNKIKFSDVILDFLMKFCIFFQNYIKFWKKHDIFDYIIKISRQSARHDSNCIKNRTHYLALTSLYKPRCSAKYKLNELNNLNILHIVLFILFEHITHCHSPCTFIVSARFSISVRFFQIITNNSHCCAVTTGTLS